MAYESLKNDLKHVNVVTTTPFSSDGEQVRHDKLRENLVAIADAGIRSYIPCGGAGEIGGLSSEEQVAVVESTVEAVGNDGSVFGGIAGNYKDAIHLIDRHEDVGADGVMLRPPSQRGKHQEGLLDYYLSLVSSTDLGVIIYRDDPVSTDEMIADLATQDNVLAVKYKDDLASFTRTRDVLPDETFDDLVWLCASGAELGTISFGHEGAEGTTSGIANFIPRLSIALHEAVDANNWERARRLRSVIRPYQELGFETGDGNTIPGANSIPALKYGQELAGLYGGPARKPLVTELSKKDKQRAEEYFQRMQDAIATLDRM